MGGFMGTILYHAKNVWDIKLFFLPWQYVVTEEMFQNVVTNIYANSISDMRSYVINKQNFKLIFKPFPPKMKP